MVEIIKEEDVSQCLAIYNYYIENTAATFECSKISLLDFNKRVNRIKEKFPFYVCKIDSKVVGYAYLDYFIEREASYMTADLSIYVDINSRGKNIGYELLNKIKSVAPAYGIKNIISVITTDNVSSQRFHEKNGFKLEGVINNIACKFNHNLGVIYYKFEL